MRRSAQRIAEHASRHGIPAVQVILHGGEPLLAGVDRMRRIITELRSALRGVCELDLRIHTNGVRLNEGFCEFFAETGVKVGISIDGDQAANDRHRRYADGRSSYEHVIRAIGLLRTDRFRHLYAGLLCTVDTANDPMAVYEALMTLAPPRIDFLLPHTNWGDPDARGRFERGDTPFGDWLITIFDRWLADGRPAAVRTFESILATLGGGQNLTEALGLAPPSLAVIETDGTYEQVDSLKSAYDGAPVTHLDVVSDDLDKVARHEDIVARQRGLAGLCRTCQECPVVTSCGGGLYAHRYHPDNGFDNPSIYCADLLTLIAHVKSRLPEATAKRRPGAHHGLSDDDFRDLAAGYGTGAAVGQLIESQRTLRRASLAAVYRAASTMPSIPRAARETARTAWAVLTKAERERPAAVEAVLAHPYTRVWAARCLEQLRQRGAAGESDPAQEPRLMADLGQLAAIAAVTAVRAGAQAELAVPVTGSAVHLPTLGRLVLGAAGSVHEPHEAVLVTDGKGASVRLGDDCWELSHGDLLTGEPCTVLSFGGGGSADWQPVRALAVAGFRVALEDTDPYRDCHRSPALGRLTDAEAARWHQYFAGAWQELNRKFPAHAAVIAAGLTVLMPMAPAPQGRDVGAAPWHAFGAIGMSLPADPVTAAQLLVHDFQRAKLHAVLDLYDLYDRADARLYPVPWQDEPRTLGELLLETYARLAVEPGSGHIRDAIGTLAASGSLTPLGARFVEEMCQPAKR